MGELRDSLAFNAHVQDGNFNFISKNYNTMSNAHDNACDSNDPKGIT